MGTDDQKDEFVITFPVFIPLLKDGSGVVMLQNHDTGMISLPVFTDEDAVTTYLSRKEGMADCQILVAKCAKDFAHLLRNPRSRSKDTKIDWVIFDILVKGRTFTVEELLKAVEGRQ